MLLRVGLPLTAVAAALTAIAVVAAGTGAPRATSGKPHAAPAPAAAPGSSLRTRLLAAFAAAGGEVLHMHSTWITGSSPSAEQDTWVAPWDAQPGQVQRQRTVIRMATGNPYVLNAHSDQDVEMIYTVPASGLSTPSKSGSAGVRSNVEGQVIDVEDTARTWSDQPRTPIVIAPAIDDPGQLRSEIAAGDFTVVRHTVVGGQPALELRRIIESPADAGSEGNTAVSYLWVSTNTYLPLKSAFISTQGTAATGHIASDGIVTYEFLPRRPPTWPSCGRSSRRDSPARPSRQSTCTGDAGRLTTAT